MLIQPFRELMDLTFPTEKGIESTPEYDPNDIYLYEDNNPEDTITVATFNNEIDDSPSHSWKQETTYYVCQVPRKEKTYILFSIDWDDNWGRYERSIHAAVEECDSIELQEEKLNMMIKEPKYVDLAEKIKKMRGTIDNLNFFLVKKKITNYKN